MDIHVGVVDLEMFLVVFGAGLVAGGLVGVLDSGCEPIVGDEVFLGVVAVGGL